MQAIVTRFFGPTNHNGSRVKAHCDAGSITVPWDYSMGTYDNHREAMLALADRLDWDRQDTAWIGGSFSLAGHHGYCWVPSC